GEWCAGVFFFQAEDGIRDRNVTGVQTCALPISRIVLNRARNVDLHRELSAQGGRFSRDLVAKWNKAWATLDRIFAHYSGATILDPMDDDLQGATSHAWGPGPAHYEYD